MNCWAGRATAMRMPKGWLRSRQASLPMRCPSFLLRKKWAPLVPHWTCHSHISMPAMCAVTLTPSRCACRVPRPRMKWFLFSPCRPEHVFTRGWVGSRPKTSASGTACDKSAACTRILNEQSGQRRALQNHSIPVNTRNLEGATHASQDPKNHCSAFKF